MEFIIASLFVLIAILFICLVWMNKRLTELYENMDEWNKWRRRFREILVMILKAHKKRIDELVIAKEVIKLQKDIISISKPVKKNKSLRNKK
jgi:hypothetical protein